MVDAQPVTDVVTDAIAPVSGVPAPVIGNGPEESPIAPVIDGATTTLPGLLDESGASETLANSLSGLNLAGVVATTLATAVLLVYAWLPGTLGL